MPQWALTGTGPEGQWTEQDQGNLIRVLGHEASHQLSHLHFGEAGPDPEIFDATDSVTDYGNTSVEEDFAETGAFIAGHWEQLRAGQFDLLTRPPGVEEKPDEFGYVRPTPARLGAALEVIAPELL